MIEASHTIVNKLGLHARAAAKLVATASRFSSRIMLRKNGREVNGKSIMGVMMLAAAKGSVVEITINGSDEAEADAAIAELISARFGEEQ